ncbi:30S ribosomal protein S9 [Candidatus Dojkabacteria bacterium]|nr:30S ribosomal protein S9 [Candidatus Dojkabacteria bacterium]
MAKKEEKREKVNKDSKKVGKYFFAFGRRKTSVSTVRIFEGKGEDTINGKKVKEVYSSARELEELYSPFKVADNLGKYYFTAKVMGGGKSGQLDSIKLALARALTNSDEKLRKLLKVRKLLTVDGRVKERKKPGLKKARKQEQYSKR